MQIPQLPWLKPGLWGAVIGAVATMIIGFSWMGWTLGSSAERVAQTRADLAMTSALTPICVDRFMKQADAGKKLVGLRETDTWKRAELVEQGGWATMPGSTKPADGLASACAEALVKRQT
jgi:hypothetical protein